MFHHRSYRLTCKGEWVATYTVLIGLLVAVWALLNMLPAAADPAYPLTLPTSVPVQPGTTFTPTPGNNLASTGVHSSQLLWLAAALVIVGALLLLSERRNR
jgi:hypothetical protein